MSAIAASRLFTQPFVQAQIKENIKALLQLLCEGNSPVTGEFPAPHLWITLTKTIDAEMFTFHDAIMHASGVLVKGHFLLYLEATLNSWL